MSSGSGSLTIRRFLSTALFISCCATLARGLAADDRTSNARTPKNNQELRAWLENMVWHHSFSKEEIVAATGLSIDELTKKLKEFDISPVTKPERTSDRLLVLPYPGGRHPRIGFLDGAIRPQRETKVSVFTPWDEKSYVVLDIPEAIWSNLGLTFLAHTHIPTIFDKQNKKLHQLEWIKRKDGTFFCDRKLPNGIEFGTKVIPGKHAVKMEMWLKNGTSEKLTGLRVQNCAMLKGAAEFAQLTNDNKVFWKSYGACRNEAGDRWLIHAWDPIHNPWGNTKCPCIHADPKFPDCDPSQTVRLRGWFSYYEGKDIQSEFERIEATGWRTKPKL